MGLVCELCGSTSLKKIEGEFICQGCGCKYSLEDARKMLNNDNKVSQPERSTPETNYEVDKNLSSARRAKDTEAWDDCERYYGLVEQDNPYCIEAIFNNRYAKVKKTLTNQDVFKREAEVKVLMNSFSIMSEHYIIENEDNEKTFTSITDDICNIITGNFVFTQTTNGYGMVVSSDAYKTYSLWKNLLEEYRNFIVGLYRKDNKRFFHQILISLFENCKTVAWTYGGIGGNSMQKDMISLLNGWIEEEQAADEVLRLIPIEKYWLEHADEKKAYDDEIEKLNNDNMRIKNLINQLPETIEYNRIKDELEVANQEMSSNSISSIASGVTGSFLSAVKEKNTKGLFGIKDKIVSSVQESKNIKEQIANLNNQLEDKEAKMLSAAENYFKEIENNEERISEINKILTQDR